MSSPSLARNIALFYAYQPLNSFILDRGIWMLFLVAKGFSLSEIGLVEAMYHATIFLFEIPTGYLADRYGKRASLLLAQLLGLISAAFLTFADDVPYLITGFVLGALVGALQSGATSAMVYETLQAQGRVQHFKRLTSHLSAIALISMGLSGGAGGILSELRWEYVYGGKMVIHLLALLIVYPMREAGAPESLRSDSPLQGVTQFSFFVQLRHCFAFLQQSRPFLTLSLLGMLLYSMAWTISFYSQLLFQANGFNNAVIGTLNGLETWISAAITAVAYIGERRIGKKASLVLASIGFAGFLLVLSTSGTPALLVGSFVALSICISYIEPLLEAYLNELVPSSMRATMLSVFNMMVSCGMILTFWTIGFTADRVGIGNAIQSMLMIWIPLMLAALAWCLYHTVRNHSSEAALPSKTDNSSRL